MPARDRLLASRVSSIVGLRERVAPAQSPVEWAIQRCESDAITSPTRVERDPARLARVLITPWQLAPPSHRSRHRHESLVLGDGATTASKRKPSAV
jgi:hypothetical protein